MKIIKLLAFLLFLSPMALAINFSGVQSISGLGTIPVFTAPASTIYFINGQLTLPQPSMNGGTGQSGVVATVSKNYTTLIYQGLPGANGFQVNQMTLASNDLITVGLSSVFAVDEATVSGLNAITGQVYFGNAF